MTVEIHDKRGNKDDNTKIMPIKMSQSRNFDPRHVLILTYHISTHSTLLSLNTRYVFPK